MADARKTESKREDDQFLTEAPGADTAPRAETAAARATVQEPGHMADTARDMGSTAVIATREVIRGAIGVTEDVAAGLVGGVTHVAAELIHGVRDVGYEVTDSASGLIGAAGAVGGTAVHTVADLLVDVVGGVRQVIGAAMGRDGNGQRHRFDRLESTHAAPADIAPARPASAAERPAAPAM